MTKPLTGPSARDEKFQPGPGLPAGVVVIPTLDIPGTCVCSWAGVTAGPGRQATSRLKYMSIACPHIRDHRQAALASQRQGLL